MEKVGHVHYSPVAERDSLRNNGSSQRCYPYQPFYQAPGQNIFHTVSKQLTRKSFSSQTLATHSSTPSSYRKNRQDKYPLPFQPKQATDLPSVSDLQPGGPKAMMVTVLDAENMSPAASPVTKVNYKKKPSLYRLTPILSPVPGFSRKSLVYADKPQTLEHLEDNIRRVIADIRPQMLEKVIENWTSR
ncbi:hypothetical protein TNCV_3560791 [Trichonephila clavipes]|nr:hypothetical protein TNCV_3560791 [Trichonephila clavipes]